MYEFETLMPGNYTSSRSYLLYFATLKQDTFEPVNWVYNITIPWQNCTGDRYIAVAFIARKQVFYNENPKLILEIQGCRGGICDLVVKSDLIQDALMVVENNTYLGKNGYGIRNSILDYDYFNITLTPFGLVVQDFSVGSQVHCLFQYELTTPILTVKPPDYKHNFIHVPESIDTAGLQTGIALSIAGLTIMIASIYLYIASKI